MPCFHPKPAWQARLGGKLSFTWVRGWRTIMVPCTTCHGCVKAHAQAWAFRCYLEMQQHQVASFATLTYDEQHVPVTLEKRHVQLWLKRLRERAAAPIRFFAAGEYGERNNRPHYHAILYGFGSVGPHSERILQDSWGMGRTTLARITPRRIAYCAGYAAKKVGWREEITERVDPTTGEVYTWQPPFIQMSLKPGLGSHARQWKESWRSFAVYDGAKLPVPRYLHKSWRDTATEEQLQQLQKERDEYLLTRDNSLERLEAAENIALAKQRLSAEQRNL